METKTTREIHNRPEISATWVKVDDEILFNSMLISEIETYSTEYSILTVHLLDLLSKRNDELSQSNPSNVGLSTEARDSDVITKVHGKTLAVSEHFEGNDTLKERKKMKKEVAKQYGKFIVSED